MTDMKAIDALIEAIQVGDRDRFWKTVTVFRYRNIALADEAFSGSLDAAKALHDALVPKWATWDASRSFFGCEWSLTDGEETVYACTKHDPARAWLLAILKAFRQQEANP